MAEIFFPFDAGAGAAIGEAQWQKFARRFLGTGVTASYLNALAVIAPGSTLSMSAGNGDAWLEGYYYENGPDCHRANGCRHWAEQRAVRLSPDSRPWQPAAP